MQIGAKRLVKEVDGVFKSMKKQVDVPFDTINWSASKWKVGSVTAAYLLGRIHGGAEVTDRVISHLSAVDSSQRISEALSLLNGLTSDEYNKLMRRFYNASH